MARVNETLPDDLAAAVRAADVDASAVTQAALTAAISARSTDAWLASLDGLDPAGNVDHGKALDALDEERDEATARHE